MKHINLFIKEAKKTEGLARAVDTASNIGSLGLNRFIINRALQGKKNSGVKGGTKDENKVLSKIKADKSGKHRIARFMTHPVTNAAGQVISLLGTAAANKKLGLDYKPKNLAKDVASTTLGAVVPYGLRQAHYKALLGRAKDNKKVVGKKTNDFIQQIRKSK